LKLHVLAWADPLSYGDGTIAWVDANQVADQKIAGALLHQIATFHPKKKGVLHKLSVFRIEIG
jgi:hypothetical protein